MPDNKAASLRGAAALSVGGLHKVFADNIDDGDGGDVRDDGDDGYSSNDGDESSVMVIVVRMVMRVMVVMVDNRHHCSDLSMEKGLKKRQILLGHKVKVQIFTNI